jgi:hypothetical protein
MPHSKYSPAHCRSVLRLRDALRLRLQRHSYRAIGEALGISHTQARRLIWQALAALPPARDTTSNRFTSGHHAPGDPQQALQHSDT